MPKPDRSYTRKRAHPNGRGRGRSAKSSKSYEEPIPPSDIYVVERIVGKRVTNGHTEYYIKWQGKLSP